jgi:carboxymethylenebutenolidase
MGENVEFPSNGHTCGGYLARPDGGSGPGVVVIQEWWGLVPHIRDICDRFALEGFVALAPDLYHGKHTKEPDEAGKLLMELQLEDAARDINGAVAWLLAEGGALGETVGIVGFCAGGALALYGATIAKQIGAVVAYYPYIGRTAAAQPDYTAVSGAALMHLGERDEAYTREQIEGLEEQLRASGKPAESHWYDAGHAFFNDDRPEVFDEEASELSWDRTIRFFREHLASSAVSA